MEAEDTFARSVHVAFIVLMLAYRTLYPKLPLGIRNVRRSDKSLCNQKITDRHLVLFYLPSKILYRFFHEHRAVFEKSYSGVAPSAYFAYPTLLFEHTLEVFRCYPKLTF